MNVEYEPMLFLLSCILERLLVFTKTEYNLQNLNTS